MTRLGSLTNLVVDTNIFVHASNSALGTANKDCCDFLDRLVKSTAMLAIDEGKPSKQVETSLIFQEYRENLGAESLGHQILANLLAFGRVQLMPKKVAEAARRAVNQLISKDKPRDRTFLLVTINSADKLFISNDFEDFPEEIRGQIAKSLLVEVSVPEAV